jgi:hypothetical protein
MTEAGEPFEAVMIHIKKAHKMLLDVVPASPEAIPIAVIFAAQLGKYDQAMALVTEGLEKATDPRMKNALEEARRRVIKMQTGVSV